MKEILQTHKVNNMHEQLTPNHEAIHEVAAQVDALSAEHALTGEVDLLAAERVHAAESMLRQIEDTVGADYADSAVAEFVDYMEHSPEARDNDRQMAIAVGVEEIYSHPATTPLTASELHGAPTAELGEALRDFAAVEGDGAVDEIIVSIEKSGSGIPEFDKLDDYSPEFPGQKILHRSNAEFTVGDIVLPSDQISPEIHKQLNASRSFTSTSSPNGSVEYDKKLAHAGTRDFGRAYGEYLYVVEPLEGDTLKWGENFGADVNRGKKAKSPAIELGSGTLATTDSHTGKLHNEVVSTKGFRVVERVSHEPIYEEAMLPWPISPDAVRRHKDRRENSTYTVTHDDGHAVHGFIQTTSRRKPNKIGVINSPGTYRAGANDQIAANLQTKFDVRKQLTEHPGQIAIPDMPIARYRTKNEGSYSDNSWPPSNETLSRDEPLPGMENVTPVRPLM